MFWTWGAILVFAALRVPQRCWRELLTLAAVMCAAIAVADIAAGIPLSATWAVDAVAIGMATLFAAAAVIVGRQQAPIRAMRRRVMA
jgi:hypothetical protein